MSSRLSTAYGNDLDKRLKRFNQRTGYALVIVVIQTGEDESISQLVSQFFLYNQLEKWGLAGTVFILITVQEGWVIAEPSVKIESKFLTPWAIQRITNFWEKESADLDSAVERRVQAVVEVLDPWFYVLDPASGNLAAGFFRSPTAEMILFPLVPFLGLMAGGVLMAFTSAGRFKIGARGFVCGCVGCLIGVATAFLVRQRGGIVPGMVYYSASMGLTVSALVGVLRPYWIAETPRGRKPGEIMHPPFFGRG